MATQLTYASFAYFLVFCATMTFSPGPMTLLLMGFGMQEGLKRSMPVQLGASAAYLVSILFFAVGFAELVKGNVLISRAIQYIGVVYLLYLAYRQWTSTGISLQDTRTPLASGFADRFGKGLLTGFSNPKTIVMFSAVFPQFAGQGGETRMLDVAALGLAFLLLQFASGCLYCYFGQRIRRVLQSPARQRLLQRATAFMLLGVAVLLARGF
ncbi:LysE family translocator [Pseudomonas lundensis]|uniref:LysE family translocator n=1 Tax=Pseudomonas lundensis TaxID=86185 RepID=UPI00193B2AC4|nr:LysE family translocator [Pseudomonas lundensis]MBM1186355.1 LysE family translocator [Pseudomonas lundensis]